MKKYLLLISFLGIYSCENESSGSSYDTIHEFELHSNNRVSSLLMTINEYDEWVNNDGFSNTGLRTDLVQDIYQRFDDDYDFIILLLNEPSIPENLSYYGRLIGVSNSIEGIGLSLYDFSTEYGSSGKLKALIQMTGLEYLKYGPALHELAHQWANFALPTHSVSSVGTDLTSFLFGSHWGFTGGNTKGQLGGFEQSSLVDNGQNSYSVGEFGTFANGGNGVPYNDLELYLMGMLPISEVADFDMFANITALDIVSSTFNFSAEDRTTFTPESLEELLGQREPSFEDSQKDFKILAVVLTDHPLSEEEWTKVDDTVEWFSNPSDDGTYLYNFWEATRGIGTVTIQNNYNI
tara:strand:+ start:1895 stop:2944 length:1050 start_codon:yes stop_codon:yes gene_type:complete